MRITDVKLRLLSGSMPVEAEFWEERLSRPLDIYPEHKAAQGRFGITRLAENSSYPIEAVFVRLRSNDDNLRSRARLLHVRWSRQRFPIAELPLHRPLGL
jgi:hypothetical protein